MDHLVVRLWRMARPGCPGGALGTTARLALLLAYGLFDRARLLAWLGIVETHHRLVAGGPPLLRLAPGEARVLWQTLDRGRTLQLMLERGTRLASEGELAMHLDVDAGGPVASLAFTLGCRGNMKLVYAGTLEYAAHAPVLHGMPAEEFLRAAFRALCGHLGATRILALVDGSEFDPGPFELDIALDAAALERQALLARVTAEIARACGQSYTPTLPLVRRRAVLPV